MNVSAETASRRTGLRFASIDAVKADVDSLRRGYSRAGNWSLPQICWHLRSATELLLHAPTSPATPEQVGNRPILDQLLATGVFPGALSAPEFLHPPVNCGDNNMDPLFATLDRLVAFDQPVGVHRRFGPLPKDVLVRLVLIHCAHHLSFLTPTTA